jgi:tetratricopeptide (TPR) repeat protein
VDAIRNKYVGWAVIRSTIAAAMLWPVILDGPRVLAAGPPAHVVPDFARLPDLKTLHALQLKADTTDAMLVYVQDLHELRDLAMPGSKITGAGLRCILGLTQLQRLNVSQTRVDDAGLECLKPLVRLKRLRLAGSSVTGMGLAALKPLQSLEVLDLSGITCIFDDDLKHLERLPGLRDLNLEDAVLGGPGLRHLAALKQLERLTLPRNGLDAGAVADLHKLLPRAKIFQPEHPGWVHDAGLYISPNAGPSGVWDPYWKGDYPRFVQVVSHWDESPRHTWETALWLGHAYALQGEHRKALDAYHRALEECEKYSAEANRKWARETADPWPLLHYIAEYELRTLADPKAAVRTLSRIGPRIGGGWDDPSYPEAEILRAEASESAGDFVRAIDDYLRLRYPKIRNGSLSLSPPADEYLAHVRAIQDKVVKPALVSGESFALLSPSMSCAKLLPGPRSLCGTAIDGAEEDVFAFVAPRGKVIASLEFDVVPAVPFPGGGCTWGVPPDTMGGLFEWKGPVLKPQTYAPEGVSTAVFYLYFPRKDKTPGIKEVTVRVLKWGEEKAAPKKEAAPNPARAPQAVGPFEAIAVKIPDVGATPFAGAALGKPSDSRWLAAVPVPGPAGPRGIMLSTSRDMKRWTRLRPYEHNDLFDAIEPMLFQEGEETWMFYRSNRFDLTAIGRSEPGDQPYGLWITRTHDGVRWTRPIPVSSTECWYRKTSDTFNQSSLVRTADGSYAMLYGDFIVRGIGPGPIAESAQVSCPVFRGWPTAELKTSTSVYDADGRCHLIGSWRTNDVFYCQPSNILQPENPQKLFHAGSTIRTLLPVIKGHRLLLVCLCDENMVLYAGTIQDGKVNSGKSLLLADVSFSSAGRQLFYGGNDLYLPIGGRVKERMTSGSDAISPSANPVPRSILLPEVEKVEEGGSQGKRRESHDPSPCLLHGEFDKVYQAILRNSKD